MVSRTLTVTCGLVIVLAGVGRVQAQDSLGMHCVSVLEYWQRASDIQMVGDTAYVCGGQSGLHIMDLSDPTHPVEIGRCVCYYGDGGAQGVFVVGNRAYVIMGPGCLVYDVSDVTQPILLGQWEGYELSDIFVLGDIAIIVGDECHSTVFDISDLENVHQIGSFAGVTDPMFPIGMVGEYLCMNGPGISLWDMSDPSQPSRIAAIDTLLWGPAAVAGNYVYHATGEAGLRIIDFSNPLQPVVVAVCDSGVFLGVTVAGTHAVVSKVSALHVWNVADPTQPVLEGTMATQRQLTSLFGSGNVVCAINYQSDTAVTVVDISNPAAPVEASSFGPNGGVHDVAIQDTIGYLSGSSLHTLDLSDPAEVSVLGSYDMGGIFAVHGDYGYMTHATDGFCVFDVGNPAQPESLACYPIIMYRIVISGDYGYGVCPGFGGGPGQLKTIALQDPVAPELVDEQMIPNAEAGFGLAVANGHLYLAPGIYSFRIYSLADPSLPDFVGSCPLPSFPGACANDLAVAGNYAYVADKEAGLRIIDVGNPAHPVEVNFVWEFMWRVAASGTTLITQGDGLKVWDIMNPLELSLIGYYATEEWLRDMDIAGPYLYTVSFSRLVVYQCDALLDARSREEGLPRQFALYPCYPNPFNPTTTIRFSLPQKGHVELIVYDISGRQVKVLADAILDAGEHAVTFDGSELPSGIYVTMLKTGTNMRAEKMMLIR